MTDADDADFGPDPLRIARCAAAEWTATTDGELIIRRHGERIARALAGESDPPIKSNALRQVYRLTLAPGACVFIKRFDESSPAARIKRAVRGPAAQVEWGRARRAAAAGVPVPEPLAVGVGPGVSYLMTASCLPAENLDRHLAVHGFDADASQTLVGLLRRTHAGGLLHGDLHAGNILYRQAEGRMWLLDLQRAAFRTHIRVRQIIDNLAPLIAGLSAWLTTEQLRELLSAYHATAGDDCAGVSAEAFGRAVCQAAERHADRLLRSRSRAVLRTGKYFARIALPGGWRGHVYLRARRQRLDHRSTAGRAAFSRADWEAALADVRELIDAPPAEGERVHKDTGTTKVVRRVLRVGGHCLDVFVKHYPWRARLAALVEGFRRSRATRAFRDGHHLAMHGLPTALPLACLTRRMGPVLIESVLITESAVDALPLHRFIREQLPALPPHDAFCCRRTVAEQIGQAIATLFAQGWLHRDLKTSNVLVHCDGQSAEVILIDLDGLRWLGLTRSRALRRLAAGVADLPGVTRTDRLRVLLSFLPAGGEWRGLWREMDRQSGRQ